ncbi:MAG: phospholipase D family protein [Bacillus sp. (in: Bacteria)]|nr:phospholipase D family protein [Bacillus sp. (in: firmicutes)]
MGEEFSQDRIVLIEDRVEAGVARVHLIENAEETIDLAYFTLHGGTATDILFSSLVDAADRGVQVRFLLDGIFHNLRGELRDIIFAYSYHPNIEIKFYEPLDLLRPWTWNNRLHDKMIMVDNELAMVGGRNIGDKYFAPTGYEGASNDRDLLVINTKAPEQDDSVLKDMENYFQMVWEHEFTSYAVEEMSSRQEQRGKGALDDLRELHHSIQMTHGDFFHNEIDWLSQSLPANQVTFIHNPIERFNKEPWVWQELTALMEQAEESIFIQSPYIIPSEKMMEYLDLEKVTAPHIAVLTNSLAASPNVLAFSGYSRYREKIVAAGIDVYEFQGPTKSLHAKTYVFDDRITAIGAFNLDPRSAFLSTEVMLVVDSEELVNYLKNKVASDIQTNSLKVLGDGSYEAHSLVSEEEVSFVKSRGTWLLSWITRFVEYML